MILVTAGDADDWNFDGIKAWYKTDMRYLGLAGRRSAVRRRLLHPGGH